VLGKIADLQAEISPNHPVQISRTTSWLNPERNDDGEEGQWADDALSQKAGGGGPLAARKTRAA
jgi:hypothetical protein